MVVDGIGSSRVGAYRLPINYLKFKDNRSDSISTACYVGIIGFHPLPYLTSLPHIIIKTSSLHKSQEKSVDVMPSKAAWERIWLGCWTLCDKFLTFFEFSTFTCSCLQVFFCKVFVECPFEYSNPTFYHSFSLIVIGLITCL